jgi:hypothetical protein
MIKLTADQKFQVLMTALQERYNASHEIRGRSIQFALWMADDKVGYKNDV